MKREEGQALVEFALVLPILLLLVCVVIDIGWVFSNRLALSSATRDATRYAAIHINDETNDDDRGNAEKILIESVRKSLNPRIVSWEIDDEDRITIKTEGHLRFITGITGILTKGINDVKINCKSTMIIEP